MWRFVHDSHPLRYNLLRRGMKIDPICPVCGRDDENGGHLFFKCRLAKQTWNVLGLEDMRQIMVMQNSLRDVMSVILSKDKETENLLVTALWFIWANRNAVREEGRGRSGEDLGRAVRAYAYESNTPR